MNDSPTNATSNPHSKQDLGTPPVGRRQLFYFNDQGQPAHQIYELTADDFLNPQAGDEFFHGELHDRTARILAGMLHYHFRYNPTTSVHIRPKLVWPDPTWPQPMPDVAIVSNLVDPQCQRPIIDISAEQSAAVEGEVTVRAIFEVTSPLLIEMDMENKRILYQRAGVQEYWVIDTGVRGSESAPNFDIIGYRLQEGQYQPITRSTADRWESMACRLWLSVSGDHRDFQVGDLRTGKVLPTPSDDDDPNISTQAEASRRAQSIADQLRLS